jgi:hypothetical protein
MKPTSYEEIDSLREQLTSRENRITELEQQLRERREIEEKVDEVALEVREQKETSNALFPVRWYNWWKAVVGTTTTNSLRRLSARSIGRLCGILHSVIAYTYLHSTYREWTLRDDYERTK